jgi:hypothetical protein
VTTEYAPEYDENDVPDGVNADTETKYVVPLNDSDAEDTHE